MIDFRGLDCFTYIDYVEALSTATAKASLYNIWWTFATSTTSRLPQRKRFFTDWAQRRRVAEDITAQLSPHAVTLVKTLNRKADGSSYLPGAVVQRSVTCYPQRQRRRQRCWPSCARAITSVFTPALDGLDVTHTGIFVMTDGGPVLRNASSRKANMRVVDSPLWIT